MSLERHVERAVNGTFQIGPRLCRWPWQSEDGRQLVFRLGAVAGGGWSAWRLGHQWPWLWALMVAAAIAAGYALGETASDPDTDQADPDTDQADPDTDQADPDTGQADPAEPHADGPEQEPQPMPTRAETRQLLIDSVRELAGQRQGVHLEQLHTVWSLDGDLEMDLSEFRRWVESHGLIVRDSLKTSGRTRIGMHLDDLPVTRSRPAPEPTPPLVPDELLQDW